jgi:GNAT superfamily N-acetyltransferase
MRPRGHAGAHLKLSQVARPDDPRLAAFAALLERTFPDPDSVLGLDRIQQFLTEPGARTFNVLVAEDGDSRVLGGSVFSYVARANCGFSEYLVLEPSLRGRGLGRQLFDGRRAILDGLARECGHVRCRGLFIEVDSPERTPPELLAAERESSLDAYERLRLFDHLGFSKVDVPYVQPPLGPGKQPVDYLDLLFAAWEPPMRVIPVDWILQTLEPIWTAWAPSSVEAHLARLRQRIGSARLVSLDPLSSEAAE